MTTFKRFYIVWWQRQSPSISFTCQMLFCCSLIAANCRALFHRTRRRVRQQARKASVTLTRHGGHGRCHSLPAAWRQRGRVCMLWRLVVRSVSVCVLCLFCRFVTRIHARRTHWLSGALHINLICDKTFVRLNLVARQCIVIAAITIACVTVVALGPVNGLRPMPPPLMPHPCWP